MHDRGDDFIADRAGIAGRAARPRIDRLQAALPIPLEQPVKVLAREAIGVGRRSDAELTTDDVKNSNPRFRHPHDCHL